MPRKRTTRRKLVMVVGTIVLAGAAACALHKRQHRLTGELKYATIHEAARRGDVRDVRKHLSRGADVDAKERGRTPLRRAAFYGHRDVAGLLLAWGADMNARDDEWGHTPRHQTAVFGHPKLAKLLLQHRAKSRARRGSAPVGRSVRWA